MVRHHLRSGWKSHALRESKMNHSYNYSLTEEQVNLILSTLRDKQDDSSVQLREKLEKQLMRWKEWDAQNFSNHSIFTGI